LENYLESLNESQREAVTYCDGPQLVIAGAGSGKTRVLTTKIAYLLQSGYQPDEIIALTFTKKAANEMKERITQLVGPGYARRLWMGTFHSLFSRILRREAEKIDFKPDFTIYDQSDSRNLVKSIIKEMGLDEKKYKPAAIQGQISTAKNNLITPGMYAGCREWIEFDNRAGRGSFAEIYQRYWVRCYQAKAMDFDDLLLYTNILFRDHPEVLEFYQDYFKYILVDEYQDTNRAQHLIVEQLSRHHRHLCVVGDDAQSIYSFRGANIANIINLRQTIPGTRLFKLEQNYRSTQNIVDAANSLIRKNTEQIPKTIYSCKDRGSLISVNGSFSDLEEAYSVAGRIATLHNEYGYAYKDCAILYRTNAQSRAMEEALRKRGIAYHIYGGVSFYQRKEIKDIIAYLRLIANPADEEAFKRVINYPARGIGNTTLAKISEAVATQERPFFEICSHPEQYALGVNKSTAAKLTAFAAFIESYSRLNTELNVYDLTIRLVVDAGIKADLAGDTTVEGMSRRENVEELLSAMQAYVRDCIEEGREEEAHLTGFLADVSLSGDVDPDNDEATTEDSVTLMTIHSAKGLEFKNVFVVGVEENLLPSDMSFNEPRGVEEERRLFYVAITRAEENCFLSYATSRFRNGHSDSCRPSRFLTDIDQRYLRRSDAIPRPVQNYGSTGGGSFIDERPEPVAAKPAVPRSSVLNFTGRVHKMTTPKPAAGTGGITYRGQLLTTGMRIVHERFGRGVIRELYGEGDDARIMVDFDTVDSKVLLLKFAKIRIE
jgi:DNA helicase-2/ATP-dependent DNA helicase PcrA